MLRKILRIITSLMLLGIVLYAIAVRFISLENYPPGFFVDEAACAAHTVCLQKYGTNCDGVSWPMYSRFWGNGRVGPAYQYSAWLWIELFGGSKFSFRALSSFFGVLAALLAGLVARGLAGNLAGFWTFFAALLSPWGFHSTRLAWDPAIAPTFLVLAVFFLICSQKARHWYVHSGLAAIAVLLTFHAYSPVGAQAAFLFTLLFLLQKLIIPLPFKKWLVFGLCGIALFSSVYFMDTSLVQGRVGEVSILGDDSRNPTAGKPMLERIPQFGENILKHYQPDYLIYKGEFNLRHTVNDFGILSWVDDFALIAALLLMLALMEVRTANLDAEQQLPAGLLRVFLLGFVGYLTAAMAAGLTWDSLPHGLRSIGGWPFIALASGAALTYINRFVGFRVITIVVALLFISKFQGHYTGKYAADAVWWFDKDVSDQLSSSTANNDFLSFDKFMTERQYPAQAKRYFDIQYFGQELK